MENVVHLLTVLAIFIFVLFITYFTTKWVAGYSKKQNITKNIDVIETYRITSNKYVAIIRTGSKYLAVGVGKDSINMLAEIPEDGLELKKTAAPAGAGYAGFKDVLEKARLHIKNGRKNDSESGDMK